MISTSKPPSGAMSCSKPKISEPKVDKLSKYKHDDILTPEDTPWLFTDKEVKETPSRLDGISEKIEFQIVDRTTELILECCSNLQVNKTASFIAIIYFQRFFMLESMIDHNVHIMAAACVLLACKECETLRDVRSIIYWTVKLGTRDRQNISGTEMFRKSVGYDEKRLALLEAEIELIRVLDCYMKVDNPYDFLEMLIDTFFMPVYARAVYETARGFIIDSLCTYLNVMYDPREIAGATFFMAASFHNQQLPDGTEREPISKRGLLGWQELFGFDLHRVTDICTTILASVKPRKRAEDSSAKIKAIKVNAGSAGPKVPRMKIKLRSVPLPERLNPALSNPYEVLRKKPSNPNVTSNPYEVPFGTKGKYNFQARA